MDIYALTNYNRVSGLVQDVECRLYWRMNTAVAPTTKNELDQSIFTHGAAIDGTVRSFHFLDLYICEF